MVKLPEGVDINNLIGDLRIFSWEAADILLQYSKILKKSGNKANIIKNHNDKDPVTIADLEVNNLILKRMQVGQKQLKYFLIFLKNYQKKRMLIKQMLF